MLLHLNNFHIIWFPNCNKFLQDKKFPISGNYNFLYTFLQKKRVLNFAHIFFFSGKCSSLISLHLRTIESDGGLEYSSEVKTASTQTRPQSKRKKREKRPLSSTRGAKRSGGKSSLERIEGFEVTTTTMNVATTASNTSSPKKISGKRLLLRSQGCKIETSSSNESLYSAK